MQDVVLNDEMKQVILTQEMTQLEAELYRAGLRHRMQKRLGNDAAIEEIEKNIELILATQDVVREEYDTLGIKEGEK